MFTEDFDWAGRIIFFRQLSKILIHYSIANKAEVQALLQLVCGFHAS